MASKKRIALDLNTKVKVIESSERDKLNVRQIVEKFKIGKTQAYEILKSKADIKREWLNGNGSLKRKSKTANEDLNKIVWDWFVSARSKNVSISGPMLQEKAKEVAEKLGNSEFKASNGWLESFRKRHSILFKTVCGESGDIEAEKVSEWNEKLHAIMEGYEPKDIANGDETGLFFQALPNKTLCLKGEKCSGGKHSKKRLTIFFCGFMTGEMEKPVVIGNAAKPRCFKNININDLPVVWKSNKKAWMTAALMEEWLRGFNERMRQQKRNVLLFLDNATCHPHLQLSNVRLAWFPPGTTSVTQPMDQGVINCFKLNYRKFVMQSIIANMESLSSASEVARSISVLDAVMWTAESVKNILPETVRSCFRKAKFILSDNDKHPDNSDFRDSVENLQEVLNQANFCNVRAKDYANIDDDLATEADLEDITQFVQEHHHQANEDDGEKQDPDEEEPPHREPAVKTYQQAVKLLIDLQDFTLTRNDSELLQAISSARLIAENHACRSTNFTQRTLFDCWKK